MDGTDTARAGSGIKFRYMRSHWGDASAGMSRKCRFKE